MIMEFDKRTLLAFILIGLVLAFVYSPFYQKWVAPDRYERNQNQIAAQDTLTASGQEEQERPSPKAMDQISHETQLSATKRSPQAYHDIAAKSIAVETPLFRIEISSKGASLQQAILKDYTDSEGQFVHLLPAQNEGNLGLSYYHVDGDTINTLEWNFSCDSDTLLTLDRTASATVSFVLPWSGDAQIRKVYTFYGDRYDFDLAVQFINMQHHVDEKVYYLDSPTGIMSTEKRLADDMHYAKVVLASGKRIEKDYKDKGRLYHEAGAFDWMAVRTKYFTLVMMPENRQATSAKVFLQEVAQKPSGEKWKKFAISLGMPFLNTPREGDHFRIYVGPLDDDLLKCYGRNLEKTMDFGAQIIQPFSIAILWTFKKIHTVVPNYGVVLIIFAFLIKLIVWPLTHKSYESMNKMKLLQPKLEELKEKCGNDQQRYQKEMMELYKREKVNPMSGCLPMVLQMPLLYGLFIVFRSTIELRGAGFIGWIKDLSMPDTVYTLPFSIPIYGNGVNVLPLLMGATMIWQQKMSVTDPKQKAMVYMMPIFFILLFNTFPSGLNLYYALFNVLSILQQKLSQKTPAPQSNDKAKKLKQR
jgi:YidC/Oxa1 family membrane protein insertase